MKTLAIILCILMAQQCHADKIIKSQAVITDVVDGDTVIISNRTSRGVSMTLPNPVDLDGIDAPELDQPGGEEAKQLLTKLLKGKNVSIVELTDSGKSRRAWLFIDDQCINLLMTKNGYAWFGKLNVYDQQNRKEELSAALTEAQSNKSGIWKQENPIHPSEWRKQNVRTSGSCIEK
jgi:endonuclease YncB( thermonuclease family)